MFLSREARKLEERKRAAIIRGRIHRKMSMVELRKLDPLQEPLTAVLAAVSLITSIYRRKRDRS